MAGERILTMDLASLRQSTGDALWVVGELAQRLGISVVPIQTQLSLIDRRAKRHARRAGVPEIARQNLASVFEGTLDPAEIARIATRYVDFSWRKARLLNLANHAGFRGSSCWELAGREHLDDALRQGCGAIIVTGHFGLPKIIPRVLQACGNDVLILQTMGNQELERINRLRRAASTSPRRITVAGFLDHKFRQAQAGLDVRPMLETLARNGTVVVTGDGLKSSEFVYLSLLGREYPYPTGFVKIAALSSAALLPAFAEPVEGKRVLRVRILSPLRSDPRSVQESVAEFAALFDEAVRSAPHLWYRWNIRDVFRRALEWSQSERRWSTDFSTWYRELDRAPGAAT